MSVSEFFFPFFFVETLANEVFLKGFRGKMLIRKATRLKKMFHVKISLLFDGKVIKI